MISNGFCIWLTGLPSSGKTTIAECLKKELSADYCGDVEVIDGDEIRKHLSKGLGFSKEGRTENIQRVSWVASRLIRHGTIVIVSCVSPYRAMRENACEKISEVGGFTEVFVHTPLSVCEQRDVKGMYKKARAGEIKEFTGVSDPYEEPSSPDVTVHTAKETPSESAKTILTHLSKAGYIHRKVPRALYVGRWQPFHNGHFHIIKKKLDAGVPVAIGVRDTVVSEHNPYDLDNRIRMIRESFPSEDVIVVPIPDIESINIGRKVGYAIEKYDMPQDIEGISATEIRKSIEEGDGAWRLKVPVNAIKILEEIHKL